MVLWFLPSLAHCMSIIHYHNLEVDFYIIYNIFTIFTPIHVFSSMQFTCVQTSCEQNQVKIENGSLGRALRPPFSQPDAFLTMVIDTLLFRAAAVSFQECCTCNHTNRSFFVTSFLLPASFPWIHPSCFSGLFTFSIAWYRFATI